MVLHCLECCYGMNEWRWIRFCPINWRYFVKIHFAWASALWKKLQASALVSPSSSPNFLLMDKHPPYSFDWGEHPHYSPPDGDGLSASLNVIDIPLNSSDWTYKTEGGGHIIVTYCGDESFEYLVCSILKSFTSSSRGIWCKISFSPTLFLILITLERESVTSQETSQGQNIMWSGKSVWIQTASYKPTFTRQLFRTWGKLLITLDSCFSMRRNTRSW